MSDVKWIKIATDIFDDEKILLIESMPSPDSILVIWLKLLTLAGKQNNSGVFLMNDRIPYTDEMLATIFRRDINTVRLALKTFEMYGMIEILEGVITIPNWSKHQTLDKIEKRNEYHKNYMKEYRAKQKILACKQEVNSEVNSGINVNALDVEEEVEEEVDIEDIHTTTEVASGTKVSHKDIELIIQRWNINQYLAQITKLSNTTKRYKSLKARILEHGLDNVLKAINNISQSDFLQGKTKDAWIITFDWFVKPNNFVKVLEGQYITRGCKNGTGNGNRNSKSNEYEGIGITL